MEINLRGSHVDFKHYLADLKSSVFLRGLAFYKAMLHI